MARALSPALFAVRASWRNEYFFPGAAAKTAHGRFTWSGNGATLKSLACSQPSTHISSGSRCTALVKFCSKHKPQPLACPCGRFHCLGHAAIKCMKKQCPPRVRQPSSKGYRASLSATCFWKTCGVIGKTDCVAPVWNRFSRFGDVRRVILFRRCSMADCALALSVPTRRRFLPIAWGRNWTTSYCAACPQRSIRVARTGSFILSPMRDRCSEMRSRSKRARASREMALSM
jgi:hypothetical protein